MKRYRTSELAQALLVLKGKKLSFENYTPFEALYDIDPPMLTMKSGRQIGKSVGLGGIITLKSVGKPYFNSLYLAPLSVQTRRFSAAYLDPYMASPLIKKYFTDTGSVKNVFEKSFANGSRVYLSYAETESDADRIRGINADSLYADEVQDISYDALPAIYEVLSASDYGFKRFTGTSKTLNNTLEYMWKSSNQMEWVVKCTHCSKHIIPADFDTCFKIVSNRDYPVCPHCAGRIDVRTGQWISMRPDIKHHIGAHLGQIIIPANTTTKKWGEVFDKVHGLTGYSRVKVANEVFGIAEDTAGRSLSMAEAQSCCNSERPVWDTCWPHDSRGIIQVVLGVDWSVTGGTKSFTVVSVLGYDYQGKAYLLFSEKMQGIDILDQVARVQQIFHQFNATLIASDRGVGVLQVQLMQRDLGADKVVPINYVASNHKLAWNSKGRFFSADRTQAMDTMVIKIKKGRDRFESPSWTLTAPFWQDGLNIYEEESNSGRRLFRHAPDDPDDWFHSIVFANIGHQVITGDFITLD